MASDQTIHPRHHWPAAATELYLRDAARIEAINGPFGAAMFDAVQLRAGERVLDVGCGLGTTTLDAARLVSRNGSAVGIDITVDLLDVARQNAATGRPDQRRVRGGRRADSLVPRSGVRRDHQPIRNHVL